MPELVLQRVKSPAAVQKVDGVAGAKEMGMNSTLQASPRSSSLDNLVGPLLTDMAALARAEDVVIALQPLLLCMEQDGAITPANLLRQGAH